MKLKYIITGTGRCGTLNIAHNFTKIGIHCGHESIFDTGGLEKAKKRLKGESRIDASEISKTKNGESLWFDPLLIKADSSYMAAPFLQNELFKDTTIIHLIRHPLKVISSFIKNLNYFQFAKPTNQWEKFIYNHVQKLEELNTPLERACEYYIEWNKMIQKSNSIICKIEENPNKLLNKLQLGSIEPSKERNLIGNRDKDFKIDDIPDSFKQLILEFIGQHYDKNKTK